METKVLAEQDNKKNCESARTQHFLLTFLIENNPTPLKQEPNDPSEGKILTVGQDLSNQQQTPSRAYHQHAELS